MKKLCLICFTMLLWFQAVVAQTVQSKLEQAVKKLESDPQMKHALLGFYVVEANTGKVIFSRNGMVGLAPASTQKILTSVAAFDILGGNFTYKTEIHVDGINDQTSNDSSRVYVVASGDPTFGSSRWKQTSGETISALLKQALSKYNPGAGTRLVFINNGYTKKTFPDGWIWQDIGNYYGAQSSFLNWQENMFDIRFNPGARAGEKPELANIHPSYVKLEFDLEELSTGARGSGDSAYVYMQPDQQQRLLVAGTVPAAEPGFKISAAHPDPVQYFSAYFQSDILEKSISTLPESSPEVRQSLPAKTTTVYTHTSPPLDSINFWFMRRSINLYGESLLRTISLNKTGKGSTETGVEVLRNFFNERGLEKASIHIFDGSGLSPQNRISPEALVQVLRYAQTRSWYKSFYSSLPTINGVKMKSGSILGARAYAGYHTSKTGQEYIFSIIVNNYDGSSSAVVRKMWAVIDGLK